MSKPTSKSTATRSAAKSPVRKAASKSIAKPLPPPPDTPAAPRASKNILTAGIKALTNAHEEAVARQSRVFESLLGLGPKRAAGESAATPAAAMTLDPFGFKKFEDVFDQRVARAMLHLGVPTAEAFAALQAEVERLHETVATLEARSRKR